MNNPINAIDPDGRKVYETHDKPDVASFEFKAKIRNESDAPLPDAVTSAVGKAVGDQIDGSFSGSQGMFREEVEMNSEISFGDANEGETQITIVNFDDKRLDIQGEAILGNFSGDFGEQGEIFITTSALAQGINEVKRTGTHEFGHSHAGFKGHPTRRSNTLMDSSVPNSYNSTVLNKRQLKQAVKTFRENK